MDASFEGFDDLNSVLIGLAVKANGVTRELSDVIDKSAHDIEATAKQLVPVDTGATKNSIGVDRPLGQDLVAVIGPTTEYAVHLEYGTARMGPRAFMGPSLDIHTPGFVQAVGDIAADLW